MIYKPNTYNPLPVVIRAANSEHVSQYPLSLIEVIRVEFEKAGITIQTDEEMLTVYGLLTEILETTIKNGSKN